MNVKVTTHYQSDDPEFLRDYLAISIKIDGKLVADFGDCFDCGKAKMEGFVTALHALNPTFTIGYIKIADQEI